MKKVWCVFEESHHSNVNERDIDGKNLVGIFADELNADGTVRTSGKTKAWYKLCDLSGRQQYNDEKDDLEKSAMQFIELTQRDETEWHNVECVWTWSMEERMVE